MGYLATVVREEDSLIHSRMSRGKMQQLAVQTLPGLDQGPGPHSRQQGQRTEVVFAKRRETELKATCISTAEHAVPSQKPKLCWGTGGGRGKRLDVVVDRSQWEANPRRGCAAQLPLHSQQQDKFVFDGHFLRPLKSYQLPQKTLL